MFAAAAQIAECRLAIVEVAEGADLAHVAVALVNKYPQLKNLLAISRWAVDQEFAPLDSVVNEQHEVAMIPPVSGG